jgi:MoxR-like ATPase
MTTSSTHASADSESADSAPALPPIVGEALVARAAAVRDEVAKAFIGQDEVLDQILIVLLAGGHVLIEGVPGLGKTLLVRALGQALGCGYGRVQFTPDLMPSDVSGHAVYDPEDRTLRDPSRPDLHQPAAGR